MSPRWAAVVVAYESGPLLTDAVSSLLGETSAGGPPEVVVVDNGSHDGSIELLAATHPDVAVLRPGANLGYARAANLGIAATTALVVAVVNPDAVLEPGGAAAILDRFDADPRLGAVGRGRACARRARGGQHAAARTFVALWRPRDGGGAHGRGCAARRIRTRIRSASAALLSRRHAR